MKEAIPILIKKKIYKSSLSLIELPDSYFVKNQTLMFSEILFDFYLTGLGDLERDLDLALAL